MTEKLKRDKLTVYLSDEVEAEVYADFVALCTSAVKEVTQKMNKRYINQKELCELFRCGVPQVREWQAQGLKSFPKGKEIFFDMEDVAEFINTLKY